MKNIKLRLLVLLCVVWGLVAPVWADEPTTLSVRGEAQLMLPPDQVTVSVGVVTEAKTAEQALADNSRRMERVIRSLASAGLNKQDYSTRRLTVQPLWSSRPRNADATWRPEIIAYRVSHNLDIKTRRIDSVGQLITAVTQAGANQINSIRFGLTDPRSHRGEAIIQATDNARADAEVAATASGLAIRSVQSITLASAESIDFIAPKMDAQFMRAATLEASAPPINAGDVTVRATVSIIYELSK